MPALFTRMSMRPKVLRAASDQGLHLVLFRHVAPDGHGLGSKGLAGGNGLIGRRFVARVAEHHVGSAPGQLQTDRPAQPPAAAGDDGCFLRKIHSDAPLIVSVSCSSSAAVSTAYTGSSGTVFFTKPLRALPGPISTSASSPMAAMRRRESSM